jgi:hypothetical protein
MMQWRYSSTFLNLLRTPRETAPGTHCIGGWVGSEAAMDFMEEKNLLFLEGMFSGK